jgi:ribose 5-phosphate isomerase A
MLSEEIIDALVEKYIRPDSILAFGTSREAEVFLKKVALKLHDPEHHLENVSVVPTSSRIAAILSSMHIPIADINEREIDIAVEFVDIVDRGFNYIKRNSHSLVRDKMIAQSAAEMIAIVEENGFAERLSGVIPFEVAIFGWRRTLMQLEAMGKASLRKKGKSPFRTETNHYLVDVEVDEIYSLEELEFHSKNIPGVLETGLFIGYADRILVHGKKGLRVKSIMDYSKQNEIEEETTAKGPITL